MSRSGLSKAFRCSDYALQNVARPQIQRRSFASSSIRQKHGPVPSFTATSSPELDTILSTLREKLILPAHLAKTQRFLITKEKYKKVLALEPVTATIAGEEFRLEPLDKLKDVPNARKSLFRALELMQEKSDWDNLPNLLQGFKTAGVRLYTSDLLKIVRTAGKAGRQDVILECIRRAGTTGFKSKNPELVQQVLWWFQHKALVSDWSAEETKKALSWAEMLVVLLENPTHSGAKVIQGETDPRVRPEVIGILLQLAAVRASKHLNGKDEDGKVAEYSQKLLGTSLDLGTPKTETHHELNPWISKAVPVLQGIRVARTALDPASKVAKDLKERSAELEQQVSAYRNTLAEATSGWEGQPTGLWLYEKLLIAQ